MPSLSRSLKATGPPWTTCSRSRRATPQDRVRLGFANLCVSSVTPLLFKRPTFGLCRRRFGSRRRRLSRPTFRPLLDSPSLLRGPLPARSPNDELGRQDHPARDTVLAVDRAHEQARHLAAHFFD